MAEVAPFAPRKYNVVMAKGLCVVADNGNNFDGSTKVVATAGTIDTYRAKHTILTQKAVTSLVFLYGNYGKAGSTEVGNPNQITVKCAAEITFMVVANDSGAPRTPMFFTAATNINIDKRGLAYTDPIPCYLPPGSVIYSRSGATVGTNGNSYQRGSCLLGSTSLFGQNNGESLVGSADRVNDGATNMAASTGTASYSPSAILGTLIDGSFASSVGLVGDSEMAGTDDASFGYNRGGWGLRAFGTWPNVYVPFGGEALWQVAVLSNFYSRFQILSHCTTIVSNYARNDVMQGQTLAQYKANLLTFCKTFMQRGQRFVQTTCLPAPTSSDYFLTVANQTKESTESVRVSINQWLRDLSVNGFVAQANAQVAGIPFAGDAQVMDICAAIEVDINGNLTQDGGYIPGAVGGIIYSGTSSGGNSSTTLNVSGTPWMANAYGTPGGTCKAVAITGGTGAGQIRTIAYNGTSQLGVNNVWSVTPDNTSTFQIYDAYGLNGVHPLSKMYKAIADYLTNNGIAASMVL
jgi:hypothetical protein